MENKINGKTFKDLDIKEQIDYLNSKLVEGQTVTNIRKDLGIGEKWLQRNIKSYGYIYNQKEKIYKLSIDVETIGSVENKEVKNIIHEKSTLVEKGHNYGSRSIVVDKEQFNLMLKSYKEIEKMNEKLEKVYNWYEKEHEIIDVTPRELKIDKFEGDAIARSYKFYPDIQKDFIEFCNKHKQYKTQDIICQALKEFLEKYK